jgi:PncC family amidohydrolase
MINPSQTLPLTGQGLKQNSSRRNLPKSLFHKRDLLDTKIKKILEILKKRNWSIGIMESCTGGAIANAVTNIPGASDVFGVGKVTYSIKAKIEAGVDGEIIKKHGVYSIEVAEEMAKKIEGEVGVGVTGNMNDPAEAFVAVRVRDKVESKKLKVESEDKNEIKARKEKKMMVVERVVEMISDNL